MRDNVLIRLNSERHFRKLRRRFEELQKNVGKTRATVVAKLVKWSIPKPEIRGSNPVVGKFFFPSSVLKRRK